MTCVWSERTSAWIDGELGPAAAREAERHLATCADCRALAEMAARTHEVLGEAPMSAPPHLRAAVIRALDAETNRRAVAPPRPRSRPGFWLGAASGVGASALAAGLAVLVVAQVASADLVGQLADDHVRALMSGKTIAVASSDHHTVRPWFAGRAPLAPPVSDFASQGFALAGGRLDQVAGRTAAVLVYRHGAHEIDLFVWARRGAAAPARATRRGYGVIGWTSGDLAFAAVSDVQASELERFSSLVRAERE